MQPARQSSEVFVTPPCCAKPAIQVFDHLGSLNAPPSRVINRVCLSCHHHWEGKPSAVKSYSGKEWQQFIQADWAKAFPRSAEAATALVAQVSA